MSNKSLRINLPSQLLDDVRANLRNFRQFYLTFPDVGIHYALRSELTWTHWRLVMRVENPRARDYYIEETARQQWTSRALERAIETRSFDRLLQAPESTTQPTTKKPNPLNLLKDPYILEFLDLTGNGDPSEEEFQEELERRHILDWPMPGGDDKT
jgi:hypothetical protein